MTTQARRPILLVEMVPKVEKQGFRSNAEKRDQKVLPIGMVILVTHEGGKKNFCLEETHFFLSKALWGGWQEALSAPPARTASPRVHSR